MRPAVRRWGATAVALWLVGCQWIWPERYLMRKGQAMEAKGQYAEAAKAYETVFTKYPRKPEATEALSRAASLYEERLNGWQKAASYLQELKARTDGTPAYAGVLLRLGQVLEHAGSPFRDSLETYGVLCKNCAAAKEAVGGLLAQGRIFESLQNWPAAKSVYEEAVAKLGGSPEAATVKVRLEQVWLLEATSLYFTGKVEDGNLLAEEAVKKGITSDEVRNGLQVLIKRHRKAQRFWKGNAAASMLEDQMIVDAAEPGYFLDRYEAGAAPAAPAGWEFTFDAKKRVLAIIEAPAPPSPVVKGKKAPAVGKPWKFRTPSDTRVLGYWTAPDGGLVLWLGVERDGHRRTLNGVNLRKHKAWTVLGDPSGKLLGEVAAILPLADKIAFPFEDYFVISDLKGGNRVNFALARDRERKARFRGREVRWLAATPDGFELAIGVNQPPDRKPRKGETPDPRIVIWKVTMGVSE